MIPVNLRKKGAGQSTVEFAFMLPILLAVLLGLTFFAMLFYSYLTLQLAVREGTNAITANPDIQTDIVSLVRSKTFSMNPTQVQVSVSPSWNPGDPSPSPWTKDVRVSVTATYTVGLPQISLPMFSGQTIRFAPIQIQAKSIMTVN